MWFPPTCTAPSGAEAEPASTKTRHAGVKINRPSEASTPPGTWKEPRCILYNREIKDHGVWNGPFWSDEAYVRVPLWNVPFIKTTLQKNSHTHSRPSSVHGFAYEYAVTSTRAKILQKSVQNLPFFPHNTNIVDVWIWNDWQFHSRFELSDINWSPGSPAPFPSHLTSVTFQPVHFANIRHMRCTANQIANNWSWNGEITWVTSE